MSGQMTREELLRRSGIALAQRLAKVTSACPYPIDDENCNLDCPPPGDRASCWMRWATEQACPAFTGCGSSDCRECGYVDWPDETAAFGPSIEDGKLVIVEAAAALERSEP